MHREACKHKCPKSLHTNVHPYCTRANGDKHRRAHKCTRTHAYIWVSGSIIISCQRTQCGLKLSLKDSRPRCLPSTHCSTSWHAMTSHNLTKKKTKTRNVCIFKTIIIIIKVKNVYFEQKIDSVLGV